MIRLVALDLDDTLLSPELTISPANKVALEKVAAAGVKITLASGRMYRSVLPYAEALGIREIPLITYNGALLRFAGYGEIIYHQPLDSAVVEGIISIFKEERFHVNLFLDDKLYMEELTSEGKEYIKTSGVTGEVVGDFGRLLPASPTKILGIGDPQRLPAVKARMEKEFGKNVYFTRSKPYFLECISPEVNKGRALQKVAAFYGFSKDEVLAIGDAPNDIDMLRWAGIGVAVGNAALEVKAAADWVAPAHHMDGVAAALSRFILSC